MTVSAAIRFVQGATTGTPGQALMGVTGTSVVCSNGDDTGVATWLWTVVDTPPGSTVAIGTTGTSSSFTFGPDIPGGFLISLLTTGTDGSTATDVRCFGIPQASGHGFIPPFSGDSSSLNFSGQKLGWDPYMRAWLLYIDALGSNATEIQSVPVNAPSSLAANDVLVSLDGTTLSFAQLTQDMIAPGLTVTISGSSNGTFECGNTWTPTSITASPACSALGVTAATLNDTLGNHSTVTGDPNPLTSLPAGSYTESGSGTVVSISLTMTKGGVTKTSNNLSSTFDDRYFAGCDNDATGTSATSSGNNATLVGGAGATLTGFLAALGVGTTFPIAPTGTQYGYLWCLHTATAHTFLDQGGFAFLMNRVASNVSFSNQFTVVHGFDLYVSANPLTASYTVKVTG